MGLLFILRHDDMSEQTITVALADVPNGYRGSPKTAKMVRDQIRERFGAEAADSYQPSWSARTFANWVKIGYRVKKGEKALQSITMIDRKDSSGKVIKSYPKKIFLFYQSQVERVENS